MLIHKMLIHKMLIKGFKFGMLLQLAVGPVCLFIFQLATLNGFLIAETGVFAVVIADGSYILAAILGLASFVEKEKTKVLLQYFGSVVLFVFGLNIILEVFSIQLLPGLQIASSAGLNSAFLKGLVLTASNPLTIIFWAGVFSAKIVDENMTKSDIYSFSIGAILSTLLFLSAIAMAGSLTHRFLPDLFMDLLNILVGALLIYFGIKMLFKKQLNNKEQKGESA